MFESLSPDLVLVLPPHQRAEAIRALPPFEPWQPAPLLLPRPVAITRPALHALLATAILYFVAKLALMISAAAAIVLAMVAFAIGIALVL